MSATHCCCRSKYAAAHRAERPCQRGRISIHRAGFSIYRPGSYMSLRPAATLRTCTLPEDPGEGALACVVDAAKGLRPGAAVILDFVGHPPEVAAALRQRLRDSRPVAAATTTVIDVGEAGLAQLRAALMTQAGA